MSWNLMRLGQRGLTSSLVIFACAVGAFLPATAHARECTSADYTWQSECLMGWRCQWLGITNDCSHCDVNCTDPATGEVDNPSDFIDEQVDVVDIMWEQAQSVVETGSAILASVGLDAVHCAAGGVAAVWTGAEAGWIYVTGDDFGALSLSDEQLDAAAEACRHTAGNAAIFAGAIAAPQLMAGYFGVHLIGGIAECVDECTQAGANGDECAEACAQVGGEATALLTFMGISWALSWVLPAEFMEPSIRDINMREVGGRIADWIRESSPRVQEEVLEQEIAVDETLVDEGALESNGTETAVPDSISLEQAQAIRAERPLTDAEILRLDDAAADWLRNEIMNERMAEFEEDTYTETSPEEAMEIIQEYLDATAEEIPAFDSAGNEIPRTLQDLQRLVNEAEARGERLRLTDEQLDGIEEAHAMQAYLRYQLGGPLEPPGGWISEAQVREIAQNRVLTQEEFFRLTDEARTWYENHLNEVESSIDNEALDNWVDRLVEELEEPVEDFEQYNPEDSFEPYEEWSPDPEDGFDNLDGWEDYGDYS